MITEINPFDLLSGKIVQNEQGTFYFKEAGTNIDRNRVYGIKERNLHRENDLPAVIYKHGALEWRVNGKLHRTNGPAFVLPNGGKSWWLNHKNYTEEEYYKTLNNQKFIASC